MRLFAPALVALTHRRALTVSLTVLCAGGCSDDALPLEADDPLKVEAPVHEIEVTPSSVRSWITASVRLNAVPKDARGKALSGHVVAWTTSAPEVATVDSSGLVTGVGLGAVTITATSEGVDGNSTLWFDGLPGRIAFFSHHDGSVQVYVMDADGSDVRQVTGGSDLGVGGDVLSADARIAWSPDGTRLALAGPGIVVVDASDGSSRVRVSPDGGYPVWAADGASLRFVVGGEPSHVYDVLPDGSDTTAVMASTLEALQLSWSPDLTRVVYTRAPREVWEIYSTYAAQADGSVARSLVPSNGVNGAAAWSPDGSRIALWSCDWGIAMVGGIPTNGVTTLAADNCQGVPNTPGIFTTLSWSPDGEHIAFMRDLSIWVLDVANPTSPRRVGPAGYDAWGLAWGP